jgi:hypothetical protein
MRTPLLFALVLALLAPACGTPHTATPDEGPLTARRLYPMGEGYIWTYDIDTQTEITALGISRVMGISGDTVRIAADGGDERTYELREDGIYRPDVSTWLIREPIAVGQEWSSPGGRTARITSISESVDVPAGHFTRCVEITEEGGEAGLHVRTVYCPDVGPAIVESRQELTLSMSGGVTVTGSLRGYQHGEDDEF